MNINTANETKVYDYKNYWDMDTFAKSQGYKGENDEDFLKDFNFDDLKNWSDSAKWDWLGDESNRAIEWVLQDYKTLETNYYVCTVANLEYWNAKGQTEITPLQKITDIFNGYRCYIELTEVYEGDNYLRFEISHHDGSDSYYIFFNTVEYNETLEEDIEQDILNGLDYDYYKPQTEKYNGLIQNIVNEYNADYINSSVDIKQAWHKQ